jgi:hypothetical protein
MSLEKHEHKWSKLSEREEATKLNKSASKSKALHKAKLVGKEGFKPSKFIDHYK